MQTEKDLFGPRPLADTSKTEVEAEARVQWPNRTQVELRPVDLDGLLPADHKARLVWGYVERQDLSELYARIKAVEGKPGRSPIAPEILMALWIYATLEGVGSARAVARNCEAHDAYRWLCGGVKVNHHTLSDFRVGTGKFLDELLTKNVAALLLTGAVKLVRVAQDGMRIRASAGAASFRRSTPLQRRLEQARQQVEALKSEIHEDPEATNRRQRAAQERAARELEDRITKALARLPQIEKVKIKRKGSAEEARVSTTDAEATVMKMADGGFRPAYNAQLATDTSSQVIVGVDVVQSGTDSGQMPPMVEQIQKRYAKPPEEMLVDGGFASLKDIEQVAPSTTVYAPVKPPRGDSREAHEPRSGDSPAVAQWRERMGTEEAKEIYKQRGATAECVNAQARNRGLLGFNVRGLDKVRNVALWYVLAHNLMRIAVIAPGLLTA